MTRRFLDAQAEAAVKQRVAVLERATGVEVVAAVVARADSYPEIPWKAFALGISLASLAAVAAALLEPGWEASRAAESAVAALAIGGVAALATVWVAPFARLFLSRDRRQAETLQFAQATFLEAGLHRARRGNGILLLVSLFEHEVVVFADRGAQERLGAGGLEPVIAAVTAQLARGDIGNGLLDGLARLEAALAAAGFSALPGEASEISDAVIQRKGPS